MSFGLLSLNAQNILNVKESSGGFSFFYTNDIRKLTFSGGNLHVNEMDGSSNSYDISGLKRLDFNGISTKIEIPLERKQPEEKLQLYPNPVNDVFYIKSEIALECVLKVEIFDLQGRVLKKEILTSFKSINVSDLRNGMYLCRIYTYDKIENIKFLKN
ncbi:T9SS type A sorting domain-containing protein [Carboxylicivirga sp. RSCT41]|uniref:T9SS type A sorting domain-containing protein n=1 Tax=Carboxylicivirga agarovorans TaxID=3417570 RepID=UPI003D3362C3